MEQAFGQDGYRGQDISVLGTIGDFAAVKRLRIMALPWA